MDITAMIVDYLNYRYGTDVINVLNENGLYYILGDRFFNYDRNDMITMQKNKVVMMMNKNTLLNVCDMFQDNGIDYIGFKGVILSNLLYNNSFSRNVGDIDIYVDKQHFELAYHLLLQRGYKLQDDKDYNNQHHIVLMDNTSIIELHKNIISPEMNIDESYLRKNRAMIQISNKYVSTFNVTATLLHLLYHLYMDVCLEVTIMYDFFAKKQYPKVRRFFYRAYEIAMFIEKYRDKIHWNDIIDDLQQQKLRICLKKMIFDIVDIFPDLFPDSILKALSQLKYVEDERDHLYEYLTNIKSYQNECIEKVLQNYIEENWKKRIERNICKVGGDNLLLARKSVTNEKQELSCLVAMQKRKEGLELSFSVPNDVLCITQINDYDTLTSDGIHLLLCSTEKYSYNSIFFFPKKIDSLINVIVFDVLKNKNFVPEEHMISAKYQTIENGYMITAIISDEFIKQNHMESYFYMGLIVSDCSMETHSRKAELVLTEDDTLWYDPTYFAKIIYDDGIKSF